MFAKYPSVSVTRTRAHFPHLLTAAAGRNLSTATAFVAAGGARGIATSSAAASSAATTTHDPSSAASAPPLPPPGPPPQTEPSSSDRSATATHRPPLSLSTAFIGLGTNLGSRPRNLNDAVTRLDRALRQQHEGAGRVVETSWMYESKAMYHEEQDKFLNAAVKVRPLPPSS